MIGQDLNLTLPSNTETMASNIARIAAALSAIEDSIAELATPSALNINAPLDMGGNALINTTSVRLASGNVPTQAGSIYYFNGEFYAIDSTGLVQLTAGGAINAAGVGGIVGDYGGVNPAKVTYDTASAEYRFTKDNTPTYADLKAHDTILMVNGGTGYVRMGVDSAITTGRTFYFKSLPTSGISHLVYNAATSTVEDGAVTRATNQLLVTDISITGAIHVPDMEQSLSMVGLNSFTGGGSISQTTPIEVNRGTGNATWTWEQHLPLRVGDILKSATVLFTKSAANLATLEIKKFNGVSITTLATGTSSSASAVSITATIGSPTAVVSGESYFIVATGPSDVSSLSLARFVRSR